jgi:MFS family permease
VAVTVAGIIVTSVALFYAGTAVAGAGFGSSFLGAFRTLAMLAPPQGRGGLVAAIYLVAYLAFALPAVVAGIMAVHLGLRATAIAYGIALAALAGLAVPATARATRPALRRPAFNETREKGPGPDERDNRPGRPSASQASPHRRL